VQFCLIFNIETLLSSVFFFFTLKALEQSFQETLEKVTEFPGEFSNNILAENDQSLGE
jgi:hypothetical protein